MENLNRKEAVAPPAAPAGAPSAEERQWAMFAHLSALLGGILTLLFLKPRVEPALQRDIDSWSSLLLFALIAVVAADVVIRRMRRAR
jgi:hypothetical protein